MERNVEEGTDRYQSVGTMGLEKAHERSKPQGKRYGKISLDLRICVEGSVTEGSTVVAKLEVTTCHSTFSTLPVSRL